MGRDVSEAAEKSEREESRLTLKARIANTV